MRVVANRLVDPGAYASPSQPVLQIARIDRVWINVNVPDEDLAYVRAGINVTFQVVVAFPDVRSAARANGQCGSYVGHALVSRAARSHQSGLRPASGGMLVTVTVTKARANDAVVVPRSAVAQTPNGNIVYVVNDNKAEAVPVRVGVQTDTLSQVISSQIQPGTMVMTTRPDALKDGSVGCSQQRQRSRRSRRAGALR